MTPWKKAKKAPALNPTYAHNYGLRILYQYLSTNMVVLVRCCFYVAFGLEYKVGAKHKVANNIHSFTSFQADHMKAHMEGQNAEKRWKYNHSIPEEKESFFECICPFKSTVKYHLGGL